MNRNAAAVAAQRERLNRADVLNDSGEHRLSRIAFDSRERTADSQKPLSHVSLAVDVLEIGFDGYVGAELLDA
jgi:hypothetical protein